MTMKLKHQHLQHLGLFVLLQPNTRGQSRHLSLTNKRKAQEDLADVVKVSVWDFLLRRQLFHLIQQDVHLELGA